MNNLSDVHKRLIELHDLHKKLADEAHRANQGGLTAIHNGDAKQFLDMARVINQTRQLLRKF